MLYINIHVSVSPWNFSFWRVGIASSLYVYAVGTFPSHSLWVKAGWQQSSKVGPGRRSWKVQWILLIKMEACEYELVFFMLDLNQWKWGWSNFPIVQLDGRLLQINLSLSPMFNSTCIALFHISLLWNYCYSCDCIYCVEFEHLSKQHVPLYIS